MKTRLSLFFGITVLVGLFSLLVTVQGQNNGWRKVLSFDVMATERSHRADLGNHRYVVAFPAKLSSVPHYGWDIQVQNYGDETGENLLYNGNSWHGIQDWMIFAWTKYLQTYPDVREVAYDKGNSHIKIVLVDCQTKRVGNDLFEFVKGKIEVFHKP